MKNLIITLTLLLFATLASAQTVGFLIQPEFKTSNIRKGFFAESTIYKRVGLYSDIKLLNERDEVENLGYKYIFEKQNVQWDAGISFMVLDNLKAIISRSIINTKKEIVENYNYKYNAEPAYQFAAMYSEGIISVLLGYEFEQNVNSKRVTIGLGFNF